MLLTATAFLAGTAAGLSVNGEEISWPWALLAAFLLGIVVWLNLVGG